MKHLALLALGLSLTLFTPAANAMKRPLEGRKLRCCTLIETPVVFRNPNRAPYGYDGLAIDYLAELEARLGFSCSSMRLYNANATGFDDIIDSLVSCARAGKCACEIGVAGWHLNKDRWGRVDYLPPFVQDAFSVLVRREDTRGEGGGAFFLTAFSPGVWACVAGLVLLFAAIKVLDRQFLADLEAEAIPTEEASRVDRLRHCILKNRSVLRFWKAGESTMCKMIAQSIPDISGDFSSARQRLLNFTISLCGLFLVLAYEAAMTASLVQETSYSAYRSTEDFKSCRISPERVCIPGGGAVESYWNDAIATSTCHQNRHVGAPQLHNSYDEGVEKLSTHKCDYLLALSSTALNAAQGQYCGELVPTGLPAIETGLSFVLPRDSEFTASMSKATLNLIEAGVLDTLQTYIEKRWHCDVTVSHSLTLRKLRNFFIMAFGAGLTLFMLMMLDFIDFRGGLTAKDSRENVEAPASYA